MFMSAALAAVLITVSQVTTAEAKQMAECLGLETPGQACPHQLMWVPRLACVAPVQAPWHVVGAGHGDVAFLHSQTQLVVESHPLDQCLRELAFFQAKARLRPLRARVVVQRLSSCVCTTGPFRCSVDRSRSPDPVSC